MCALVVLAFMVIVWLATGVTPSEIVREAAYLLIFVIGPGMVLYRLLGTNHGNLFRQIVVGSCVGFAAEVVLYTALAALHARTLFDVYPLLVFAAAALAGIRSGGISRPRIPSFPSRPSPALLLLVGALLLGLTYLTLSYFLEGAPLPRSMPNVAYDQDNVYALSLAGNMAHHWPATYAPVAGEPLRYYILGFVHLVAQHQVTGIAMSTDLFRLAPAVLLVLGALAIVALGEAASGSALVGAVAAALFLGAGTLDLNPTRALATVTSLMPISVSFLLAVPMFAALLTVLVTEVLTRRGAPPLRVLLLIALLTFACAGTKSMTVVVLLGGLTFYCVFTVYRERRVPLAPALALLVVLAGSLAAYVAFISGPTSELFYFGVSFFYWYRLVPLLGVVWLPWRALGGRPATVFLLGVIATGVLVSTLVSAPSINQHWFLDCAFVAGLVPSAEGLTRIFARLGPSVRRPTLRIAALFTGLMILVAGGGFLVLHHSADRTWHIATYGAAVVLATGLAVIARRRARSHRLPVPAFSVLALVLLIALSFAEIPVKAGSVLVANLRHHRSLYPSTGPTHAGVTPGMWSGLNWIRTHTNPNSVIAVDTHYLDPLRQRNPDYFYFSAFTQRSVYMEAWGYLPSIESSQSQAIQYLPGQLRTRYRINQRAFQSADPKSIKELARSGVRYMVVDRAHNTTSGRLARLPLVFQNSAIAIYRVDAVS